MTEQEMIAMIRESDDQTKIRVIKAILDSMKAVKPPPRCEACNDPCREDGYCYHCSGC